MNRTTLAAALALIAQAGRGAITVGGLPTVVGDDRRALCSVNEATFTGPYTAAVRLTDACDALMIDGDTIANGGEYTFADISRGRSYTVTTLKDGDVVATYTLAFTFLPIVQLRGTFSTEYSPATVTVIMPGEPGAEPMAAKVKYRGGYTNTQWRQKRNFHIKFVDGDSEKMDRELVGLRSDNSWLLDAGQVDRARIRNRVAMDLWRDFSAKPYYFDQEPKAINGYRSEFVELFRNDSYFGFYSLGEAIDRKQLKLKKYKDTDSGTQLRGMLWKSTGWEYPVSMFGTVATYDNASDVWGGMELKYPDIEDVDSTDWSPLHLAVAWVSTSTNADFAAHVGDYFDLPVLQDYVIMLHTLLGVDNSGKNIYWFTHNIQDEQLISIAAWDFDASVGQWWKNSYTEDDEYLFAPNRVLSVRCRLFERMLTVADCKAGVVSRYWRHRKGALRLDSLTARYVQPIERLQRAGAAQREQQKWSQTYDVAYRVIDFDWQKQYITRWLAERLEFVDNNIFARTGREAGDVNDDGVVDIDDVNTLINAIMSREIGQQDIDFDLSGDGVVDVDDLNMLINIVLGKG